MGAHLCSMQTFCNAGSAFAVALKGLIELKKRHTRVVYVALKSLVERSCTRSRCFSKEEQRQIFSPELLLLTWLLRRRDDVVLVSLTVSQTTCVPLAASRTDPSLFQWEFDKQHVTSSKLQVWSQGLTPKWASPTCILLSFAFPGSCSTYTLSVGGRGCFSRILFFQTSLLCSLERCPSVTSHSSCTYCIMELVLLLLS